MRSTSAAGRFSPPLWRCSVVSIVLILSNPFTAYMVLGIMTTSSSFQRSAACFPSPSEALILQALSPLWRDTLVSTEPLHSVMPSNRSGLAGELLRQDSRPSSDSSQGPAGGAQSVKTKPVWANQGFSSYMDFLRLPSRSPHGADTSQIQCLK